MRIGYSALDMHSRTAQPFGHELTAEWRAVPTPRRGDFQIASCLVRRFLNRHSLFGSATNEYSLGPTGVRDHCLSRSPYTVLEPGLQRSPIRDHWSAGCQKL